MENRLRNLSILVEEYQLHILDLIRFSWIKSSRENNEAVLSRIFVSVFRALRNKHATILPVHLFIYHRAVKTILKTKSLPKREHPSVKELDADVVIEDFNPKDYKETMIVDKFKAIEPTERLILCLNVRHKISIDEIATIFSLTPGTVLSKINKSRIQITKEIIKTSYIKPEKKSSKQLKETKDCFFIKNLQASYNLNMLKNNDKKRVNDHLSECKNCKSHYEWHTLIDDLINEVESPSLDNQINRHIFYNIQKFALLRNAMYRFKNNWKIKVPTIALIILIFSLMAANGFKYFSHIIKR